LKGLFAKYKNQNATNTKPSGCLRWKWNSEKISIQLNTKVLFQDTNHAIGLTEQNNI
jgi:hypothetical protein